MLLLCLCRAVATPSKATSVRGSSPALFAGLAPTMSRDQNILNLYASVIGVFQGYSAKVGKLPGKLGSLMKGDVAS